MTYTYFIHLAALPAWLSLSRKERNRLSDESVGSLLKKYSDIQFRYFDAEAFTATCSDIMMIECTDPSRYYYFIEELRDSALIAKPYFEVVNIIPCIEDGYKAFEEQTA